MDERLRASLLHSHYRSMKKYHHKSSKQQDERNNKETYIKRAFHHGTK